MLKWIKAGALAVMLSLPWALPVGATDNDGDTVVTNTTDQLFNAVDETSSTLIAAPFEELTIFVSGTYSTANVVQLQRGVGSPGSGSFERVLDLDLSTANTRTVSTFTNGPNTNEYRLKMTTFGTGAVVAYLTDWNSTPTVYLDGSHYDTSIVAYDEFINTNDDVSSRAVINVEIYLSLEDGGGTIAAHTDAVREGAVQLITDGGAGDDTCFGYLVAANNHSLVSDGITVFETNVAVDDIASAMFAGVGSLICNATSAAMFTSTGTTVAGNDTTFGSIAAMGFDDNATALTSWMPFSEITAGNVGANSLTVDTGTAVVASTYDKVRLEIDALGNVYFYLNDRFVHAEPLGITTTAEIGPILQTVGSGASTLMTVDYLLFVQPRPTGPSS